MRAEIKALHQRLKTTTIYVTHDQIEAMTMADKIVVMNKGVIEQVGAPLELYDRPTNRFVAGFIGSPAMNILQGRIAGGSFVSDRGLTLPLGSRNAREGSAVAYGIRPEHFLIGDGGIPLQVNVVEPTGYETQIILKSEAGETLNCISETASTRSRAIGSPLFRARRRRTFSRSIAARASLSWAMTILFDRSAARWPDFAWASWPRVGSGDAAAAAERHLISTGGDRIRSKRCVS